MTTPPVSAAESPVHDRDGAAPALRKFEVRTAPAAVPPTDTAPRPSTPARARSSLAGSGHQGRHRPDRHVGVLRTGDGSAGLDPLHRHQPGRQPAAGVPVVDQQPAQHQLHRRRWRGDPRHPGHAHPGRGHRLDRGPDRRVHRDLPRRVRQGRHRPGGLVHGRHPHGRAVHRRGAVHLRGVGDDVRLPAGRVRRLPRARPAHAAGRRPVHGGDAQARPERAARGVLRTGRAQVGDHRADRAADRVLRHRHGHPARVGPDHRGDGSPADPRPLHQEHRHEPLLRLDADAARR